MDRRYQDLLLSIGELEFENSMLRQESDNIDRNVTYVYRRLDMLEQYALRNCVEIIGAPDFTNENCIEIVKQIGATLGVEISVIKAERLGSIPSSNTNRIVAKLLNFEQKKRLMESARTNQLSTAKQGEENVRRRHIIINDHLSDSYKLLLYKTKIFAQTYGFRRYWYKNCKIFVQKDDTSIPYYVQDETDFVKIYYHAITNAQE